MASGDLRLNQLPNASPLTGTETYYSVQNNRDVKVTGSLLSAAYGGTLFTRVQIPTLTFSANTFFVSGFSTAGDKGAGAMYTSVGAGSSGPMAIQDASHTWFQLVLIEYVNVCWFGAKGDGATDDSAAILAAVNVAYGDTLAVYFPAGTYRITQDAVLTQTVVTNGTGLLYYGDGKNSSTLRLDSSGGVRYFYNNGSTPRMRGNEFSELNFEGMDPNSFATFSDIPDNSRGFRLWATTATGSNEQNFHFSNCSFAYLNNVFETAGDNVTSENSWTGCDIAIIKNSVLSINNPQSFNHEFHATNFTIVYGDTFSLPNAGGAVKMFGGSVILASDKGSNTYFYTESGNSAGFGGRPTVFDGVRFELRGATTNLINLSVNLFESQVQFANCLFEDQSSTTKANWTQIQAFTAVQFDRCTFYEPNGTPMQFSINSTALYGETGTIVFDTCQIPDDWSDRLTINHAGGLISARHCYSLDVGAQATGVHIANDFDYHSGWATGLYTAWGNLTGDDGDGSPMDNHWRLKTAPLKLGSENWKDEQTLKLPKNSIIKNIHLRKPGQGADATVVTFNISRNDKTGSPHLTSNNAAFNTPQTGDTTNYFYYVGSTTNERTLRLYPNVGVVGNTNGGVCIVEYY